MVAWKRGDLTAAETYLTRTLAIQEKQALASPISISIALTLNNLGAIARDRGDLDGAEAYIKRGLAIQDELAPNSLDVARSLGNLGFVASNRGDLEAAETYLTRALTIQEKHAPDSLEFAAVLNNLGNVARKRGDLTSAEAHVKRALVIQEKLAPGSADEAASLHDLGLLHRKANRIELAGSLSSSALSRPSKRRSENGEAPRKREPASEPSTPTTTATTLMSSWSLKESGEAFRILEKSRAQTLLAMLAERDLVFTADLPGELERERKRMHGGMTKHRQDWARLNPVKDPARIEELFLNRIRELRDSQSQIVDQIRQQSPRLASLQYPQPLGRVRECRSVVGPRHRSVVLQRGQRKDLPVCTHCKEGVRALRHARWGSAKRNSGRRWRRFRSLIQRQNNLGTQDLTGFVERGGSLCTRG